MIRKITSVRDGRDEITAVDPTTGNVIHYIRDPEADPPWGLSAHLPASPGTITGLDSTDGTPHPLQYIEVNIVLDDGSIWYTVQSDAATDEWEAWTELVPAT